MRIAIVGVNFSLTEAIKNQVHRCLDLALGSARDGEGDVIVRVWDTNGVRGGIDKACRICLYSRLRGDNTVEAVDADLYRAISSACLKLRQAFRRERSKRRTIRRRFLLRPQMFV